MTPDVYAKARAEIIALFGWNADSLTPDQTLRLDCAVALRLALDDLQGRVVRGESVDVARMLTAADALSRLLPPAALAAPPPEHRIDPRQYMWKTYLDARRRGELADPMSTYEGRGRRIAELEAKVAEFEAAASPAPGASSGANAPVGGNVVRLPTAAPPASAAPAAPPKPEPPPAAASAPAASPRYDYDKQSDWKNWVNEDGSIRSTPLGAGKDWGPVG
jgi:hypothetical protein